MKVVVLNLLEKSQIRVSESKQVMFNKWGIQKFCGEYLGMLKWEELSM